MELSAFQEFAESFSLMRGLEAASVLVLAWIVNRLLASLFRRLSDRFTRYRLQLGRVYPLVRLAVWVLAAGFAVFEVLQPPENVVFALAASSGIAIGLGAQDLLRNAWAGVYMLFDRPFSVGDMVQVGEHYGEVLNVGLNFTRLKTFDDSLVTVPNGEVVKLAVVNSNAGELTEMIAVNLDVPAALPVDVVKAIARESAVASPYAYLRKPIAVILSDRFDLRPLTRLTVKAYVVDIRLERRFAGDVVERFKRALQARGLIEGATAGSSIP